MYETRYGPLYLRRAHIIVLPPNCAHSAYCLTNTSSIPRLKAHATRVRLRGFMESRKERVATKALLEATTGEAVDGDPGSLRESAPAAAPRKSMRQAIWQIVIADLSMSLDNVLAVAGIARDHTWVLVTGLVFSVAFMGLAAAYIARLLDRYHWIAYIGLVVIFYVAIEMIVAGARDVALVSLVL